MIILLKKKIQHIFKSIGYSIFKLLYGRIISAIRHTESKKIIVNEISLEDEIKYKIYKINSCRLYTDTIHDTAFIIDDKIVEGPSFQIRNNNYAKINKNVVFTKGTPYFLKNFNGSVLSLLTGGAGNHNYWHWLFDVLPRIKLFSSIGEMNSVDYFLVPSIKERFQREILAELNIPKNKIISSQFCRHIKANSIIATDHPYVIKGDSSLGIQNIPSWIVTWLNLTFTRNLLFRESDFPKKFYIDRSDSKANTKELRKITNEDEVKEVFINNNYKILNLSNFSFLDQVRLFYNAECIVGLHGAGFANLVFSKKNTKVLEFRPDSSGLIISNLAKTKELNYSNISVKPHAYHYNSQFGHILIPLEELRKKII